MQREHAPRLGLAIKAIREARFAGECRILAFSYGEKIARYSGLYGLIRARLPR